jgi:hypothetical protein
MLNVWQPSLRVCGIKVRSGWIAPTAAGWSKNLMVAPSFAHPTMSEATRIASGEAEIGCVVPTSILQQRLAAPSQPGPRSQGGREVRQVFARTRR